MTIYVQHEESKLSTIPSEQSDDLRECEAEGQTSGALHEFVYDELDATMQHAIDVTNFVARPTEQELCDLNRSIAIDVTNPFDAELIGRLLSRLQTPIENMKNYHRIDANIPHFKTKQLMDLGMTVSGIATTRCDADCSRNCCV